MKIGLIDVDSHNFPNLCLMKLSAYHKAKGHTVEWWNAKGRYDLVYKSRVFTDTYSKDTITVTNAEQVIFGGTGYDTKNRLPPEVEHSYPDYSIYPQFFGIAYGFLSRGCPRNCGFCIVSSKEGRKSVKVADLSEFWKWQPEIKIMDANLLACPDHENLIEQLIRSRAWVDFSQGLDIRLVNRDNVSLLNRVRIKAVHFAWDNPDEDLTGYFQRFLDLTAIKSSRQRRVYVLTNYGSTHEQDLYRVNTLRATEYGDMEARKALAQQQKELFKAQARMTELDTLFRKLYEDNALGRLTDERFVFLTSGYEDEKKSLAARIDELQQQIATVTERKRDISRFIQIVGKYSDIQELTYENVHEFIDRILIHELDRETNTRKIEIHYSFVGQVDTEQEPTQVVNHDRRNMVDVKSIAI